MKFPKFQRDGFSAWTRTRFAENAERQGEPRAKRKNKTSLAEQFCQKLRTRMGPVKGEIEIKEFPDFEEGYQAFRSQKTMGMGKHRVAQADRL
jgi:hypothetical protein